MNAYMKKYIENWIEEFEKQKGRNCLTNEELCQFYSDCAIEAQELILSKANNDGQTAPLKKMSWEERYRYHESLAIECIETAKAKVEAGNFGIAQCYLDCVPKHIESMTGCIQVSNAKVDVPSGARSAE